MTIAVGSRHSVEEIRIRKAERTMLVTFEDGRTLTIPAELLRVESPSAEVQGHAPGEKKLVTGKRLVGIIGVEPVGHYAVKIIFDDGHDSGLYTWDYLFDLGENQERLMAEYEADLAAAGQTRDGQTRDGSAATKPAHAGCACGSGGKGGCGG